MRLNQKSYVGERFIKKDKMVRCKPTVAVANLFRIFDIEGE